MTRCIFIVNGEDVEVQATESLRVARDQALRETRNTGRAFEEWEIRNQNGILLPPEACSEDCGLLDGARLFLTLRVGAGGHAWEQEASP